LEVYGLFLFLFHPPTPASGGDCSDMFLDGYTGWQLKYPVNHSINFQIDELHLRTGGDGSSVHCLSGASLDRLEFLFLFFQ